jgi:hypothetical protein
MVHDEEGGAIAVSGGEFSDKGDLGHPRPPPKEGGDRFDLSSLTTAERLWIWRRRHPSQTRRASSGKGGGYGRGGAKMSANEAAAMLGVKPDAYCAAENGEDSDWVWSTVLSLENPVIKPVACDHLTLPEKCALARRRSGREISEICASLGGISKPTFLKRETVASPEIIEMWQTLGYRFTKNST